MKGVTIGFGCLLILAMMTTHLARAAAGDVDDVSRVTLKNGLQVVAIRNTLAPVVAVEVNYLAGSNEAPAKFPGVSHGVEHMMFRGSPGLSQSQLAEINGELGDYTAAYTAQTYTQYDYIVPSEDLSVALHIEAIRMRGLDLDDAKWTIERGVIEQEMARDQSNPDSVFQQRLQEALFSGSTYEQNGLATRDSIEKTTAKMLRKFYDTWYVPNNAVLVVVGDIDTKAVVTEIESLFGSIPAKPLPRRKAIKVYPAKVQNIEIASDQPYGQAAVAFQFPGASDPDYAAAKVLGDVLSSRRGPLYSLVSAGVALNPWFQTYDLGKVSQGVAFAYCSNPKDSTNLSGPLEEVLRTVANGGVSDDMVEAAKQDEIAQLELGKTSIYGLANSWSTAAVMMGLSSPGDMTAKYAAVTVADVDRVAKKYLKLDHAVFVVMTPVVTGHVISGKLAGGEESFAAVPSKSEPLPSWAEATLADVHAPHSSISATDITLANGLRLIVQPESVSDTVSIYGQVKMEPTLEQPVGKEGVDTLLQLLFNYGSAKYGRIASQKALDDIAASEQAGPKFYAEASSVNFEKVVKLLADNELHPTLPEEGFRTEQSKLVQAVKANLLSSHYIFNRATDQAVLPLNDPELREATPSSISALTIEDVESYYKLAYRPDLTTIVVIGHITPEQAQAVIEKYFGDWRSDGPKPDVELPSVPANKSAGLIDVPDKVRVQAIVHLTSSLGLNIHSPDRFALQLGNAVLSREGATSWLWRDLRRNSGMVYVVNSRFDFTATRALFTVSYGADPGNINKAKAMIVKDLQILRGQPLSIDDVRRAQAALLRAMPLSEADESNIANSLLFDSANGLPLDEMARAAQQYMNLTPRDVLDAYSKDIDPNALVQTVMGPTIN